MSNYRLHWFLVVVDTIYGSYINSVYGGALEQDAREKAYKLGGRVIWVAGYGIPYCAGEKL